MRRTFLSAAPALTALAAFAAFAAYGAFGAVSAVAQSSTPPTWTKPTQFWFQRTVPGGHVWLNVDAEHGVKEPLFDHQRLAIELEIRTGTAFTPLALPFADPAAEFVVKYDGSNAYIQEGAMAIEFLLDGRHWRCDLQTKWNWNKVPPTDYECLSQGSGAPGATRRPDLPASRVSPDVRWEARVEQHNVIVRAAGNPAASSRILSSDGTSAFPYAQGSLHWSDDTTLAAYRVHQDVWQSESLMANVKDKVARGTWTVR